MPIPDLPRMRGGDAVVDTGVHKPVGEDRRAGCHGKQRGKNGRIGLPARREEQRRLAPFKSGDGRFRRLCRRLGRAVRFSRQYLQRFHLFDSAAAACAGRN